MSSVVAFLSTPSTTYRDSPDVERALCLCCSMACLSLALSLYHPQPLTCRRKEKEVRGSNWNTDLCSSYFFNRPLVSPTCCRRTCWFEKWGQQGLGEKLMYSWRTVAAVWIQRHDQNPLCQLHTHSWHLGSLWTCGIRTPVPFLTLWHFLPRVLVSPAGIDWHDRGVFWARELVSGQRFCLWLGYLNIQG